MKHAQTDVLGNDLTRLERCLPEALISPFRYANIGLRVAQLSANVTGKFGFECQLANGDHRSDFQFAILAGSVGQRSLAGDASAPTFDDSWSGRAEWSQVQDFAREWSDMSAEYLPCVILGVDCEAHHDHKPALLLHLRTEKRTAQEVASLIPIAAGGPLPPRLARNFDRCLAAAIPVFVGFMFGRATHGLRLTQRLTISETVPYLREIGWSGDESRVSELLTTIQGWTTHVGLSLNIGETVDPYLGLEILNWTKPISSHSVWRECLQTLVDWKLCTPEKHAGLLAWRGISHEKDGDWSSVPRHCSDTEKPTLEMLVRRLSHIKLVMRPNCPLEAKAYLDVQRITTSWPPGTASVDFEPSMRSAA